MGSSGLLSMEAWAKRKQSIFPDGRTEELDTALQLCFTGPQGMVGIEALKWRYSFNFKELKQQNGIFFQKFSWLLSEGYAMLDGFSC